MPRIGLPRVRCSIFCGRWVTVRVRIVAEESEHSEGSFEYVALNILHNKKARLICRPVAPRQLCVSRKEKKLHIEKLIYSPIWLRPIGDKV